MDTNPVAYWNAQAREYDENIFSTIDEDSTGVIEQVIRQFACTADGPMGRCIDMGCGAGKYLRALGVKFREVAAYDLSPKLTSLARKEAASRGLQNVTVGIRDLAQPWYKDVPLEPRASSSTSGYAARRIPPVTALVEGSSTGTSDEEPGSYGFAVMANVLIAPVTPAARTLMLRNAWRALCPGGHLLAVVPSLESALYVNMRCDEANYEGPYTGKKRSGDDVLRQPTKAEGADVMQGIMKRSGVRTKHYLEPEFTFLVERAGFKVLSCDKVLYRWHSELGLYSAMELPPGLREASPLPWDWLFVLHKPDGSTSSLSSASTSAGSVASGQSGSTSELGSRSNSLGRAAARGRDEADLVDVGVGTTPKSGLAMPSPRSVAIADPVGFSGASQAHAGQGYSGLARELLPALQSPAGTEGWSAATEESAPPQRFGQLPAVLRQEVG